MTSGTTSIPLNEPAPDQLACPKTGPRLWPAVALVSLFWAATFAVGAIEKYYFMGFLFIMAAAAVLLLLYSIWWWTNRGIRLADRVYGCLIVVASGVAVAPFCHKSIAFGLPTQGLPLALTVLTLWLVLVKWTGFAWNRLGLFVVIALTWGYFTLVRVDGVNADLKADTRWRWSLTDEEIFLAEKAQQKASASESTGPASVLSLSAGDWPAFRGPERDGVIRGVTLATNWKTAPPKLLSRQRVGPAWSSVIVIGDRLFTQEQRGEQETVVCYEASTGKELWIHEDTCRFWEAVSGAGPRATPTFADGRLFTLGATGILNCLDAATGTRHWSHDIAVEASTSAPLWGYSGSPLVVDDKVIVFAGGEANRNLLAYRTESGELAWAAPASQGSYASPQLLTIAGQRHCLLLGDHGLTAVDPATGHRLWEHGWAMPGAPRTVQAHLLGTSQLLAGTLTEPGVGLVEVTRQGEQWKVSDVWSTTQMKPEFPDFVVHQGFAYGFDGAIFCCIDLAAGNRRWKQGRYGRGQVMLLPEQSLLLVISETGEALLLAANPERHTELGRFRALSGKTWNHPVITQGRLYARNAEEMACYELANP
jgi:outer membrane protein assembly factor BamB